MTLFDTRSAPDHRRRLGLAAVTGVVGVVLLLPACGDDDDAASTDGGSTTSQDGGGAYGDDAGSETTEAGGGGAAGASLVVSSIAYEDVTAPAGGSLDIENTSGAPHTFTSDDGDFDTEVPADGTASVDVPAEPGSYGFHCEIHPSMAATLTVE
jgi:plastocyanin